MALCKADASQAKLIYELQREAFLPLLAKYRDYDTNPASESLDQVTARLLRPRTEYVIIRCRSAAVGAIGVRWDETAAHYWVSPLFIIPRYQGRGLAQQALVAVEAMYPIAETWSLATILEEQRNCHLYEKMGYRKTGVTEPLNEHATLVYYFKHKTPSEVVANG